MTRYLLAPLVALIFKGLALGALCAAIFVPQLLAPRRPAQALVLLDRSLSVPASQSLLAWRTLQNNYRDDAIATLEFAGRYRWRSGEPQADAPPAYLQTDATNIAQALWAALARTQSDGQSGLVLISDGYSTAGEPTAALRALHDAGVPVCWLPAGQGLPPVRMRGLETPSTVLAGVPFSIDINLESTDRRSVLVTTSGSDGSHTSTPVSLQPGADNALRVSLTGAHPGPLAIRVTVLDPQTGVPIGTESEASLVEVTGQAHVLYVSEMPTPLAVSLRTGGWPIERVKPALAPTTAEALAEFQVVVLDDVAIRDAPDTFWSALARQISNRGLGLIVLGGPKAFAQGGYLHSGLEPLLPVVSEADAGERTQAVAFVVDKSGSMGLSSTGVDRLSAARSAVIAAARSLDPQDETLLLAFDIQPHLLIPLSSYQQARSALEGPWAVHAGGGTRMEPALVAAAERLAASHSHRRTLVLVTDGFFDDHEPAGELSEALQRHAINLVVLAIGQEANVPGLNGLSGASGVQVLSVADVAQLPRFARAAVENPRGRVQMGRAAVREILPMPFLPSATWPEVNAYAVTRARPEADLFLVSARDDPLLAAGQAGSGRVVVLPAGLGQWAPAWAHTPLWPRFAGALIEWTSASTSDPRLSLRLRDQRDRLELQAELANEGVWSERGSVALRVTDPQGITRELQAPAVAPGRYAAVLEHPLPGVYTVAAVAGIARSTKSVTHTVRAERDHFGISPDLRAAVDQGLMKLCSGDPARVAGARDLEAARRGWTLVCLTLFGVALLIDFRFRWVRAWKALSTYFTTRS